MYKIEFMAWYSYIFAENLVKLQPINQPVVIIIELLGLLLSEPT